METIQFKSISLSNCLTIVYYHLLALLFLIPWVRVPIDKYSTYWKSMLIENGDVLKRRIQWSTATENWNAIKYIQVNKEQKTLRNHLTDWVLGFSFNRTKWGWRRHQNTFLNCDHKLATKRFQTVFHTFCTKCMCYWSTFHIRHTQFGVKFRFLLAIFVWATHTSGQSRE